MLAWIMRHKWLTLFFSLFIAIWLFLSFLLQPLTKNAIANYVKDYGLEQVTLKEFSFNPLTGNINIEHLALFESPDSETPKITLGQFDINLSVWALLQKRILIESLVFSDSNLPFSLSQNAQQQALISLAGIPLNNPEQAPSEDKSSTVMPGLDEITLRNINLSLETEKRQTKLFIDELTLTDLYAWSSDYGLLKIKAKLNNSDIHATLKLYAFDAIPRVVGTIKTDAIDLAEFRQFIPKALRNQWQFNAQIKTDTTFTLESREQGLKLFNQGNIDVIGVDVRQQTDNSPAAKFKADVISWKGDLYITQAATIDISTDGKISAKSLQLEQADNQLSTASFKLQGSSQVELGAQPIINLNQSLSINGLNATSAAISAGGDISSQINAKIVTAQQAVNAQGNFALNKFSVKQGHLQNKLAQLKFNFNTQLNYENSTVIAALNKLLIKDMSLENTQTQQTLVSQQSLNINSLQLNHLAEVSIDQIAINGLQLAPQQKQAFVDLNQLNIDDLQLRNTNAGRLLKIAKLKLNGSETQLTLLKDNQIAEINALLANVNTEQGNKAEADKTADNNKTETSSVTPASTAEASAFNYQIGTIEMVGNNRLKLVNQQLTPTFEKTLNLTELQIKQLDSTKPKTANPFKLNIQLDEYSRLSSQGKISLLQPKHAMQIKTDIDGMALNELSAFTETLIGYHIESGQLSAQLNTQIKDNIIDAKNELQLNKLKLQSADSKAAQKAREKFPVPLETGLALLQDKNDNIDLSLPIKGDITSPDFDVNDVISTALSKAMAGATRTYLLFALQPFGAIAMATEFAMNQSSAISLQAVEFTPSSAALSKLMMDYLKKISGLLKQRSGLQIKLCIGASEADRLALQAISSHQAAEAKNAENQQTGTSTQPVTIDNAQLLQLASQRQNAIKRQLIKLGVAAKQLIICKPQIAKDNLKATVALSI